MKSKHSNRHDRTSADQNTEFTNPVSISCANLGGLTQNRTQSGLQIASAMER